MKPLVYIAGPYTNPDPVENTRRAIQVGLNLYETGLAAVEIPHLTLAAHLVFPHDVDFRYAFDLDKLDHCHAVWRMNGFSTGAAKEVMHAHNREIPVFLEEAFEWQDLLEWCRRWMD